MKKLLFALSALAALTLLAPVSGFADFEGEGAMGIYFDADAEVYETTGAPYTEVAAYVMMKNTNVEGIWGYEFGFVVEGNYIAPSIALNGTGPIDVGGELGNHIVGLAAPITVTPATLLATIGVLPMDALPIHYTLTGATPNSWVGSNTPNIVAPPGDVLVKCAVSAWDVALVEPAICAMLNDTGVVASDEASWDSVKSLYR
ncbi:MAG: hypothetical protein KOO60_07985 [Gemmatimonadales bacterium]|nr:hypothetical protein [Gemmatimonadales bacterium]